LFFDLVLNCAGPITCRRVLPPSNIASHEQTPSVSLVIDTRALATAMPALHPFAPSLKITSVYNGFFIPDFF